MYQDTNIDTPSTLTRTVEFTVDDGAGTNSTDSAVKMITVSQVNIPPTINPISPPSITILENSPAVTIPLSGINAGGGQFQNLTVTVTSGTGVNDTPGLIPNPTLTYTSPNTYGSITFQPVAFETGTSTITVTVTDSGGDVSAPVTLFVTVVPVDQAPTLTAIPNPAPFTEFVNSPTAIPPLPPTINLTGITAGTGDSQNLTVTAVVEPTGTGPGQALIRTRTSSPACRRLRSRSRTPTARHEHPQRGHRVQSQQHHGHAQLHPEPTAERHRRHRRHRDGRRQHRQRRR